MKGLCLSITERGDERLYPVVSAALRVREPAERTVDEVADGWAAIELEVKTCEPASEDDDPAPSLSIGPIYRKMESPAELTGATITLESGYDDDDHVATLYYFEHHTLEDVRIRFGRVDGESAEVEIEAACPDTEYYGEEAEWGKVRVSTTARIEAPSRTQAIPAAARAEAIVPRVVASPGTMTVWIGERTTRRDFDRYVSGASFLAHCGLDSVPANSLNARRHEGKRTGQDLITEACFSAYGFEASREIMRALGPAAAQPHDVYIVLDGFRAVVDVWPEAPVRLVGSFAFKRRF
jgi:hypothetical protein